MKTHDNDKLNNNVNELKIHQDAKHIAEALTRLDERLVPPDSLSPDAMVALLKTQEQSNAGPPAAGDDDVFGRQKKFNWRRLTSIAAAVVIVLGSVWAAKPQLLRLDSLLSEISPIGLNTAPVTGENYNQIYQTIQQINARVSQYQYTAGDLDGREKDILDYAPPSAARDNDRVSDINDALVQGQQLPEHGKTNTQVEGVDEADIIKNDGRYLYVLNQEKHNIKIADAQDPKNVKKVSEISLDANTYPIEMYVVGNSLIVLKNSPSLLTEKQMPDGSSASSAGNDASAPDGLGTEQSYAENSLICGDSIGGYNGSTTVAVYDISDRAQPKQARTFTQDGSYASSRLIGDKLYLITNYNNYNAYDRNDPSSFVPNTSDSANKTKCQPIPAGNITIPPSPGSPTYVVATALDIREHKTVPVTKSVLGQASSIYSSTENLYIATLRYDYSAYTDYSPSSSTDILKFSLDGGGISYTGSANVDGTSEDQFSMDEYNGYFRIATTGDAKDSRDSSNNVFILDGQLKQVGALKGMAPGERIYSVRFMGNMAYVVTFRQTDPLFAIDLSDPARPAVKGQLKISGFSEYLHPYSENLLIGFGYDADDQGRTKGLKLSFFDVSDPLNPKETHKMYFNDQSMESQALSNHKAFLFSKDHNMIGFPATSYNNNYSSYNVISIDPNKGFSVKGELKNNQTENYKTWYNTQTRGTYIGNTLFVIDSDLIQSIDIPTFKEIGTLNLTK